MCVPAGANEACMSDMPSSRIVVDLSGCSAW